MCSRVCDLLEPVIDYEAPQSGLLLVLLLLHIERHVVFLNGNLVAIRAVKT